MKTPSISIKQLYYLVTLADVGHFRRAAEACGIKQPSLTSQIQLIEETLGLRLVERSRSGVSLTPTGREIVARARRALDEVEALEEFAQESQSGLTGTIRLGAKPTLGPYLLPQVVARLRRDYPGLSLYIREGPPKELSQELARHVHDLILAQLPVPGDDFVTERLFREPLFLALPAEHELAALDQVPPSALTELDIISLNPAYHLHDQIVALCQEFGANVLQDYEGTSLDAVRQMVGMGMGASFLPALYARSELAKDSEVVVRPLSARRLTRSVGLVWRKSAGRADAYKELARAIREVTSDTFGDLLIPE